MKKLLLLPYFLLLFHIAAVVAQSDDNYTYRKPSAGGTGKVYMGREIAHIMSFEGLQWLERNTRMQEENTNLALSRLPLQPNSIVADLGAGSGFYTVRIAKRIPTGTVYAVEVQDDAIAYLKQKAAADQLPNMKVVKGTAQSPKLPDSAIDLAIMVDVYHELEYPAEYLDAIKKALKPKGQLLLLEYKAEDSSIAIKPEHKMSVKQVKKELEANGFQLIKNGQFLPLQHFLVFEKK